jgi:hypothetical protein
LQTGEKARYFPSSIAAAKSLSICENWVDKPSLIHFWKKWMGILPRLSATR